MHTVQIEEVELPAEILSMIKSKGKNLVSDRLDIIGKNLEKSRLEAIAYREASGIEDTWTMCEDAYAGIDDANRHEHHVNRWIKPTTMEAPVTTGQYPQNKGEIRSNAFVRLTTRYVDIGSAKVGEILLPIDGKAFSFGPTPVPDLIKGKDNRDQVIGPDGAKKERYMTAEEMKAQGVQPQPGQQPPTVPLTFDDLYKERMTTAMKKAKLAEDKVFDWMVECQHPFEMRKVIFDSARIGVGVVKGPFPDVRKRMAVINGELKISYETVPVDKWVSPWNIYPDPACGEDIRNGSCIWEKDFFSERQISNLKGLPGYIDSQIDAVLERGPSKIATTQTKNPADVQRKNPYTIWFYHGSMLKTDFEVLNASAAKTESNEKVFVIVTMVDDIVIRASLNPLDSGPIPYHAVPWIRRPGFWAGTGVAEQLFTPQRIVNAGTRSLLNNAGMSTGPQIVINRRAISPANGDYRLHGNKVWYLSEEGSVDDIRKAFLSVDITNVGDQVYKIIEYGMRLAEELSSIPLVTQGMSGKTTPETLGATQLQDNNANQLLRYIGYSFDGYVTERLVDQYYEYLLLDPNVDDEMKGDYKIKANGSVALVERAIQDQTIAQMTPLAQDPQFGVNPKKWFAVLARSKRLDPTEFQYTKEEQDAIDSQPKPQAPAVEVAKIKAKMQEMQMQLDAKRAEQEDALAREMAQLDAQITMEAEKLRNTTAQLKVKMDTDRDTVFVRAEMQRAQSEYEYNMGELGLKREIATAELAAKLQISLEAAKSKLADSVMKINAQKELAAMDAKLRVHEHTTPSGDSLMKPAVQLPGKAGQGKAASQM